jgi:hypothetical protein
MNNDSQLTQKIDSRNKDDHDWEWLTMKFKELDWSGFDNDDQRCPTLNKD